MTDKAIPRAIVLGSMVIAASIVVGCLIISHAPRFEKAGSRELIETRSGSTYVFKGIRQPAGQPSYQVLLGPRSSGVHVERQR